MLRRYQNKMLCFSPTVMLATFAIEICLAVYAVIRYKFNAVGRLITLILVLLAAFQLAEYNVCQMAWITPMAASRLGYVGITLLPPLGIHLIYAIAKVKTRRLVWAAYSTAAAFAVFFLFVGPAMNGHLCMGNYVIFQIAPWSIWLYSLYYYGWLAAGMFLCWRLGKGQQPHTERALKGVGWGYLAFLVPTTTATIVVPSAGEGIPSIMCGFAVILALILAVVVLPNAGIKRR